MTLLAVSRISKRFGGLQALADVSFDVAEGEILGVMGANGAGKTTLFAIISGHIAPSTGQIVFEDRLITGLSPDRICRRGIVRTFQIVRPFRTETVLGNVTTAALYGRTPAASRKAAEASAHAIITEFGLAPQAHKPAGALTLSDQKKLEVARALAASPKVLLLDEVMAGLTPAEVAQMVALIREIRQRYTLTLVVVEHVMRALVDLSERIVVLHHGRFVMAGSPETVAADPRVLTAYYGEAGA